MFFELQRYIKNLILNTDRQKKWCASILFFRTQAACSGVAVRVAEGFIFIVAAK